MLESLLPLLVRYWPLILLLLSITYLARNRFNHGLQKYPGPFTASLTDWWRFFDVWGRRPDITHIRLHSELGDVVRLGPNVLSFADPRAIKTIYGLNKGFTKVILSENAGHCDELISFRRSSIRCSKLCPKASACRRSFPLPMSSTMHNYGGM